MEKKTEQAIRVLIYTVVGIMALSVAASFLFPLIMKKSLDNLNADLQNQINRERVKNENIVRANEERKRIALQKIEDDKKKEERRKEAIRNPKTIYSWTNEKGIRVYSNIGLPEDGKYTDPKIEWQ